MKALIISDEIDLCWAIPGLLARAGIACDVVSPREILSNSRFINHLYLVTPPQSVTEKAIGIISQHHADYVWVIVTQDWVLQTIVQSTIPDSIKLKLLPVISPENYEHLYSKIGMVSALQRHGISTPNFRVASTLASAMQVACDIGFPVMLKIDSSGGGMGTYECSSTDEIQKHVAIFDGNPILVQKKIIGKEIDLSAIFIDTRLVYFSYSIFRKVISPFGPSVLRDYMIRAHVNPEIYSELSQIGKALGAHGFANITCIEADHKRYYFEADMRPNVWADYTSFLGDDPADHIRNWFAKKLPLQLETRTIYQKPTFVRIPYFLRLRIWELLFNRYNVWRYIRMDDQKLVYALLNEKFLRVTRWFDFKTYWPFIYRLACQILSKDSRQTIKRLFMKIGLLTTA
jgi:hypothetical protein